MVLVLSENSIANIFHQVLVKFLHKKYLLDAEFILILFLMPRERS